MEWPREKPQSVLEAADAMTEEQRIDLGREVFGYDGETAQIWATTESFAWDVLEKVRETDTCSDLRSPVSVWIDPEGFFTLEVYDAQG